MTKTEEYGRGIVRVCTRVDRDVCMVMVSSKMRGACVLLIAEVQLSGPQLDMEGAKKQGASTWRLCCIGLYGIHVLQATVTCVKYLD